MATANSLCKKCIIVGGYIPQSISCRHSPNVDGDQTMKTEVKDNDLKNDRTEMAMLLLL